MWMFFLKLIASILLMLVGVVLGTFASVGNGPDAGLVGAAFVVAFSLPLFMLLFGGK